MSGDTTQAQGGNEAEIRAAIGNSLSVGGTHRATLGSLRRTPPLPLFMMPPLSNGWRTSRIPRTPSCRLIRLWDRDDVLPSVTLCGGMGGVKKGPTCKRDGSTHHLRGPQWRVWRRCAKRTALSFTPVLCLNIRDHSECLRAVARYLPRKHRPRTWFHCSPLAQKCRYYSQHGEASTHCSCTSRHVEIRGVARQIQRRDLDHWYCRKVCFQRWWAPENPLMPIDPKPRPRLADSPPESLSSRSPASVGQATGSGGPTRSRSVCP